MIGEKFQRNRRYIYRVHWIGGNGGVRPAMWVGLGEPDLAWMVMPEPLPEATAQSFSQTDVADWY